MIGLTHYLVVAAILFALGVLGIVVNRKNLIVMLMAIELILLAVNLNLVAFSAYLHDLVGQVFRDVRADRRRWRGGDRASPSWSSISVDAGRFRSTTSTG